MTEAGISLLVLYCSDLSACHDFYRKLGLVFEWERHASGPEHHAAVLAGGAVLELYPAGAGGATGRVRVGLTVPRDAVQAALEPGTHLLRDPDGRAVELCVTA
ncbi:VOC family protein [Parafrankia sp. FMc2]|uniref:VOC family protein n=1 Tax=Parafrankia sp. FMc2 TaxID=3233196 RepID=UPI0034D79B4C